MINIIPPPAERPSKLREYRTWIGMKSRCYNPNSKYYSIYGGRGITVCDTWKGSGGFLRFLRDMGRKPGSEYSLDRIDNDGNYEPGNCRWATIHQQAANRRNSSENLGVFKVNNNNWLAHLRYKGKAVLNKSYKTKQEAIDARKQAEIKYNIIV